MKFVAGRAVSVPRQPPVPSKANNSNKLVSGMGNKNCAELGQFGKRKFENFNYSIYLFLTDSVSISHMGGDSD